MGLSLFGTYVISLERSGDDSFIREWNPGRYGKPFFLSSLSSLFVTPNQAAIIMDSKGRQDIFVGPMNDRLGKSYHRARVFFMELVFSQFFSDETIPLLPVKLPEDCDVPEGEQDLSVSCSFKLLFRVPENPEAVLQFFQLFRGEVDPMPVLKEKVHELVLQGIMSAIDSCGFQGIDYCGNDLFRGVLSRLKSSESPVICQLSAFISGMTVFCPLNKESKTYQAFAAYARAKEEERIRKSIQESEERFQKVLQEMEESRRRIPSEEQ